MEICLQMCITHHLRSKVHSCIMACSNVRNHSAFPHRLPHIWLLPGWKAEAVYLELPLPPACSKKAGKAKGRVVAHGLMKEAWLGSGRPVPVHCLLTDLLETMASTSSHLVDSKDQILSEVRVPAQWLSVLSVHVFDKSVPSVPLYLYKQDIQEST